MELNNSYPAPVISQEMVLSYLRRRHEEIRACRDALTHQNWEIIKRTGHRIKGNAETFGLPQLAPIAEKLEKCADEKAAQRATPLLNQLESAVEDALAEASADGAGASAS